MTVGKYASDPEYRRTVVEEHRRHYEKMKTDPVRYRAKLDYYRERRRKIAAAMIALREVGIEI